MNNYMLKDSVLQIYNENDFKKFLISNEEYVAVSKSPVEIKDVRFRLSLYFNNEKLMKVILVGVTKQNKEEYINRSTRDIHETWLRSLFGDPTKIEIYGCKYELESMTISSEHDPRNESDVIVINYFSQVQKKTTVSTKSIVDKIANTILNGVKIPLSMSQPVIYQEDEKYYLAVFVFFFTKDDIEKGTVDRPTMWAIANIETGETIKKYETKEKDFSDAPYDVKYNVRSEAKYDTSKSYYDKAFAILDSVREQIIRTGELPKEEYQAYLDMIVANIPKDYQRFYKDLSV